MVNDAINRRSRVQALTAGLLCFGLDGFSGVRPYVYAINGEWGDQRALLRAINHQERRTTNDDDDDTLDIIV